jgi:hypothetical protein
VRIAFPERSSIIRTTAISHRPARASAGTAKRLRVYPSRVMVQYFPVRSLQ